MNYRLPLKIFNFSLLYIDQSLIKFKDKLQNIKKNNNLIYSNINQSKYMEGELRTGENWAFLARKIIKISLKLYGVGDKFVSLNIIVDKNK